MGMYAAKKTKKTPKNWWTQNPSIFYFLFWNIFFCRSEKKDAKDMDVTQPILLPGCPVKGIKMHLFLLFTLAFKFLKEN